ncbi:MAG: YbfB/YjiJ family MFS transporter [Rhizobiaceae bacterium]
MQDVEGYNWLKLTSAAILAIFVGIGLSRFAYSPLIPVLVAEDWFTPAQTGYLGAANLAGYLAGALVGQQVAKRWQARRALRFMMLAATVAFFASATPISFAWFFIWRFVSGLTGGSLMVLAAPTILPFVPDSKRGLAAGLVFTGVGSGMVLSGTLVPTLVSFGPAITWCVLGLLSFIATAWAWNWWPSETPVQALPSMTGNRTSRLAKLRPQLVTVYVVYGLVAVGLVPHMVFLVDFIARGLSRGLDVGGWYWIVFGIGALLGPVLAGRVADIIGFANALRCALAFQIVCVALPVFNTTTAALVVSSLFVGGAVSGTVPLALGRTQEIITDPRDRKTAWSVATIVFALGQASAGYLFSYMFAATEGDYALLFAFGSAAIGLALIVALTPYGSSGRKPRSPGKPLPDEHPRSPRPERYPPTDTQ